MHRRSFLASLGIGASASLAGCTNGVLPSSSSDGGGGGRLIAPITADPHLPNVVEADGSSIQSASVNLTYYDVDGLRSHEVAMNRFPVDRLTMYFDLEDGADQQWLERFSEAVTATHDVNYGDGAVRLPSFVMAGAIEPTEFTADAGLELPPAETHRDYDLYLEQHGTPIGVAADSIVGAHAGQVNGSIQLADGADVADAKRLLLRSYADRLSDGSSPDAWMGEALSEVRPVHYGEISCLSHTIGGDRFVHCWGIEIHGDESTYRATWAAPTKAEFQAVWAPDRLRSDPSEESDTEVEISSGDTVGTVEERFPTEDIANQG